MLRYKQNSFVFYSLLLCITLFSAVCVSPLFATLGVDQAVYTLGAKIMDEGGALYRDYFDHKGPLLYVINWFGLKIAVFWGVWLIDFLLFMTAIFFVCTQLRAWFTDLSIIMFTGFVCLLKQSANLPDYYSLSLSLCAIGFLLKAYSKPWMTFFCGLSASGVFFLKQSCLGLCIGIGFWLSLQLFNKSDESRWRRFLWFMSGGVCGLGIGLAGLMYFGIFDEYFKQCFTFNICYSSAFSGSRCELATKVLLYVSPFLLFSIVSIMLGVKRVFSRFFLVAFFLTSYLSVWGIELFFIVAGAHIKYYQYYINSLFLFSIGILFFTESMVNLLQKQTRNLVKFALICSCFLPCFLIYKKICLTVPVYAVKGLRSGKIGLITSNPQREANGSFFKKMPFVMYRSEHCFVSNLELIIADKAFIYSGSVYPYLFTGKRSPIPYYYAAPFKHGNYFTKSDIDNIIAELLSCKTMLLMFSRTEYKNCVPVTPNVIEKNSFRYNNQFLNSLKIHLDERFGARKDLETADYVVFESIL